MYSMKNAIAAALAGILSLTAAGAAQAEDASSPLTMKPRHGISFDIGTKRAVSYFLSESGRCKLTLVVAEAIKGDELPTDTPVRFDVAIDAGKGARLDTAEGKSLQFTCVNGTQAMNVSEVEQFAAFAPASR
jgi:hypothetical protein